MEKNFNKYLQIVKNLTVIASAGCNLNCKYCFLADTVNEYQKILQENTKQALKDGSFLKNIQDVFLRLGISIANIEQIDFWGQEPTTTLDLITENLENWFNTFPGWNGCFFSTNGMAFTQKIIDFVIKLNEITNKEFHLTIQISYDGRYGTDNTRLAKSDTILNNTRFLVKELNKINLKNLSIDIVTHGVLSTELVYNLNEYDDIKNYFLEIDRDIRSIAELNTNKGIYFFPALTLNPETPIKCSAEDGLKWFNFMHHAYRLSKDDDFHQVKDGDRIIASALGHISDSFDSFLDQFECDNYEEAYQKIASLKPEDLERLNYYLSGNNSCGNNFCEFKIMYDGTFCNCQNSIYEIYTENINKSTNQEYYTKCDLSNHHFYINPLKDSDEEIEKSFYMFNLLKTQSFIYSYAQMVTLMYYLSKVGQISREYEDFYKILTHALVVTPINQCAYNNQVMTGSMFNKETSIARRFCNGIMNNVEKREKGEFFI